MSERPFIRHSPSWWSMRREISSGSQLLLVFLLMVVITLWALLQDVGPRFWHGSNTIPVHFRTDDVAGINPGTLIECQGKILGRVTNVKSEPGVKPEQSDKGKLTFLIDGELDKEFENWIFDGAPFVRRNTISPLAGATIVMGYYNLATGASPAPGDLPKMQSYQLASKAATDDLIAKVENSLDSTTQALNGITNSLGVLNASELDSDGKTQSTPFKKLLLDIHKIADDASTLSQKVGPLAETLNTQLVPESKHTLAALLIEKLNNFHDDIKDMQGQVGHFNNDLDAFFGRTPAEKATFHQTVEEVLTGVSTFTKTTSETLRSLHNTAAGRIFVGRKRTSDESPDSNSGTKTAAVQTASPPATNTSGQTHHP